MRLRWDSPFVMALEGTLAIHLLIAVTADAIIVTHPLHPDPPPPKVELYEIKYVPPPPPPPLEPPVAAEVEPVPAPAPVIPARPTAPVQKVSAPAEPPPIEAPHAADPDPGGGPTIAIPDLGPSATGIPVARGFITKGRVGQGGPGAGNGSGSGYGSGSQEAPVSVATIKTRALPRGDFSYYGLGKDYPAEAKQLGIEGDIRVKLVVDEHGKVVDRKLLNHLGHGLDELALTRASAIEFTPATDTQDRAVTSVVVWTFHMTLPK